MATLERPEILEAQIIDPPAPQAQEDDWEHGIFNEVKALLGFDPDAEPFPPSVEDMVSRITGKSSLQLILDEPTGVQRLLSSDEAALVWWRQQQLLLGGTGQIALPPGPAAGTAIREERRE